MNSFTMVVVTVAIVCWMVSPSLLAQTNVKVNASSHHHHHSHSTKCLPPRTILWSWTEPPTSECVLLKNGNGVPVNASTGMPFQK